MQVAARSTQPWKSRWYLSISPRPSTLFPHTPSPVSSLKTENRGGKSRFRVTIASYAVNAGGGERKKGKKGGKGKKRGETAVKGRCNHRTSIPKQILTRNDEDGFNRVRDRVYTEREIEKFVEKLYEVILCRVYSVEELSNVITSKIIIESAVVS